MKVTEVNPVDLTITVWDRASLPNKPANSSFITILLAALVLGAAIGVGYVILLEYSHDGWHPPKDAEGLPK